MTRCIRPTRFSRSTGTDVVVPLPKSLTHETIPMSQMTMITGPPMDMLTISNVLKLISFVLMDGKSNK